MPNLPKGFYAGELYCFPTGLPSEGTFRYIPGPPRVEIEAGTLKAALLTSPAGGVLSLQAVWQADPAAVDAALNELREHYPDVEPDLRVIELADSIATVTLSADNGTAHTIGPNPTSGPDSYRVVFQETITSAEKQAAISAFHGKSGVLKIAYAGTLELQESVTIQVSGDLAAELKTLAPKKPESSGGFFHKKKDPPPPPPPDPEACAAAIDRALAAGSLTITRTESPNVSPSTTSAVEAAVKKSVAKLLQDRLLQLGWDAEFMSSLSVSQSASGRDDVTFSITGEADAGEWLAQHGGPALVADAGAAIAEPSR
jgi:hypothetical protein